MRRKSLLPLLVGLAMVAVAVLGTYLLDRRAEINNDLMVAAMTGDVKAARESIASGANVNQNDRLGTALHRAVSYGSLPVVTLLVSKGVDIEARDYEGATALTLAARLKTSEIAAFLLSKGASAVAVDNEGDTPLHMAVASDRPDIAALLIKHGAKIDAKNKDGWSPIHGASLTNARFLMSKGAVIDNIYDAAYVGETRRITQFLSANPKLINTPSNEGWPPIHYAAMGPNAQAIRLLLSKGAEVNAKDSDGNTPLFFASSESTVMALLAGGADPRITNNSGNTAVSNVADYGLAGLVAMHAKGADLNAKGGDGTAPLHYAAMCDRMAAAKALIAAGADVNVRSAKGQTPLHYAALYAQDKKVMALLLEHGADPNITDNFGRTPLDYVAGGYLGTKPGIAALLEARVKR